MTFEDYICSLYGMEEEEQQDFEDRIYLASLDPTVPLIEVPEDALTDAETFFAWVTADDGSTIPQSSGSF